MAREITHTRDRETKRLVQVVSPERLRDLLEADGDDYTRPRDFAADDEWDVADAEVV